MFFQLPLSLITPHTSTADNPHTSTTDNLYTSTTEPLFNATTEPLFNATTEPLLNATQNLPVLLPALSSLLRDKIIIGEFIDIVVKIHVLRHPFL